MDKLSWQDGQPLFITRPARDQAVENDRPGIIGGIIVIGILGGVALRGHHRQAALMLFLAVVATTIVFNIGYLVVGLLAGARPQVFSIGIGGWLARFKTRSIVFRIGSIPLGSYVKFYGLDRRDPASGEPGAFQTLPLRSKLVTCLSGPVAAIILGVLILGLQPSLDLLRAGIENLRLGAVAHLPTMEPGVRAAILFAERSPWLRVLGGSALWLGVMNLMPIPLCAGGTALTVLLESVLPRRWKFRYMSTVFELIGLPLLLGLFAISCAAVWKVLAHG